MSNLALGNRDDFPEAARKHLNDAEVLLQADRFDGAGYLAGYVVECSLRTVVMAGHMARLALDESKEKMQKPTSLNAAFRPGSRAMAFKRVAADQTRARGGREHNLDVLASATTDYKDVLTSESATYAPSIDRKKAPFGGAWTPKIRYRAEGDVTAEAARTWVHEAETLYKSSIGRMIRDGLIQR
jgi:hypothetical protein